LALAGSAILYAGWSAAHLNAAKLPYGLAAAIVVGSAFVFGTREDAKKHQEGDWRRAAPIVGAMAPFLVAFLLSGNRMLDGAPAFLVMSLLVLSVQASWVGRAANFPLAPAAAAISMISLILRVAPDLFPAERNSTLALFLLVPLAFVVLWLRDR